MDHTELAWAAGFWDGEGSTYLVRSRDRAASYAHARLNQASRIGPPEVLLRFQRVVGLGDVRGPVLEEGKEPLYRWEVANRADVIRTLMSLHPWLGIVKRDQFAQVLGLQASETAAPHVASLTESLAWAAGFFDGEGSVYLAKHRTHSGYVRLEAAITQSHGGGPPPVLTDFQSILGVGRVRGPYPAPAGHLPVYRWKAHRRPQIEDLIERLWPWLGNVKRDQAKRAITLVAAQPPLPRGNPAWGNRKTHCVRGHEYATARVRPFRGRGKNDLPPRDSSQCLACVREYATNVRRRRGIRPRRGTRSR